MTSTTTTTTTTTNRTYTAEITGRGSDSTVPDNAGAVDADIYRQGRKVGEVTLKPDQRGYLRIWGDTPYWADDDMIQHLDTIGGDDRHRVVAAVEAAVMAAEVE